MSVLLSHYARILQDKRIMYLPSCVVVEMMARLYGQVSQINLSGNLHNLVPDLLVLLRRMSTNLHATAESYRQDRIGFVVGSWKEDKLRARKLFFDLMSRLGYISELLGAVEKALLYRAIEEMSREWAELDRLMEAKTQSSTGGDPVSSKTSARVFRADNLDAWRSRLIASAEDIQARTEREPDLCLVLLCSDPARRALVDCLTQALQASEVLPDLIIAVHHEDTPVECPRCALLVENLSNPETKFSRPSATSRKMRDSRRGVTIIRGRQPMPPSLAGMSSR